MHNKFGYNNFGYHNFSHKFRNHLVYNNFSQFFDFLRPFLLLFSYLILQVLAILEIKIYAGAVSHNEMSFNYVRWR